MTEETFAIVDAHHHLWDLDRNYHPWLCDEPAIPSRHGDYRAIRRSYMPEHYRRDADGLAVVKTVYVETEWDPEDPVGETRWVARVAAEHGMPHAVVAQAWLDADDIEDLLSRQCECALVRSVRHKPAAAHSPYAPPPGPRGSMSDAVWRRGFALLERFDLAFDLQTPHWHLPEAARLAADYPGIQVILNHAGLPYDRSEAGLRAWRTAMRRLASQANVAVKISGLGEPGVPWSVEANRTVVLDTIDMFGVDRCMFASNFPVDRLYADFGTIMRGFRAIVADLSPRDQVKLFHDNAVRYYRL